MTVLEKAVQVGGFGHLVLVVSMLAMSATKAAQAQTKTGGLTITTLVSVPHYTSVINYHGSPKHRQKTLLRKNLL